jgi:hypothetical protein
MEERSPDRTIRTAVISIFVAFNLLLMMDILYLNYNLPFENLLYTINEEKHSEFTEKLWKEIKKNTGVSADEKLPNIFILDNDWSYGLLGRYSSDPEAVIIYYNTCLLAKKTERFSQREHEVSFYNVLAHEMTHYALAKKNIPVERHHCLMLEERYTDKISDYLDQYFKNSTKNVKNFTMSYAFMTYILQRCSPPPSPKPTPNNQT